MSPAEKMLEKMRRTKAGWSQDDFSTLYEGFGFVKEEKTRHTAYTHPEMPLVVAIVGRHRSLAKGYADDAVKNIDALKRILESETTDGSA